MKVIETDRLILRTWKQEDVDEYFRINQDPKVIEFLMGPLTMHEVENFIAEMNRQFEGLDFTLFATEERSTGKLIGFIGLNPPKWESHFTPCVEIGELIPNSVEIFQSGGVFHYAATPTFSA